MNRRVYVIPRLLLAAGLVFFQVFPAAGETVSPVRTLEGLVGRWVDLRGQIAEEQRTWSAQSAQWRQEMELLRTEQDGLSATLARLETAGETRQERSADLLERRNRLRMAMAEVDAVLKRMQPRLAALASPIPPALMSADLAAALQAAEHESEGTGGMAARLQRMLGALKALETLQGGIHVTRVIVSLPASPRREMDVIFLGLACGFAVTTDDRLAAAGRPTPDGWRWEPLPAAAPAVRRMIQMANQDIAPALVTFPVGMAAGWQGETE